MPTFRLRQAAAVAFAAAAACGIAGCASGYHYSQLFGERYHRAPIDTYLVTIVRVDGSDNSFKPALVEPGLRKVTVQGPPGATGAGEQRTIELQVEACTRYYLVAVRQNVLVNDFTVRIDHQEPVVGCTPPKAS